MKNIEQLEQIQGDAYQYYKKIEGEGRKTLFEKVFLEDEVVYEIKQPDKYFLIGEKGSGKTAYSVYLSNNPSENLKSSIKMVEDTVYDKFVSMKRSKMLDMSTYKEIWINLIYLILSEEVKGSIKDSIFFSKFKSLDSAIQDFYNKAFKPEFVNAVEFVDKSSSSIDCMMKQGVFSTGGKVEEEKSKKHVEQGFEFHLMKIRDGFERIFKSLKLKNKFILFIDGVDARPDSIENVEYLDCLSGLVKAIITLNDSFVKDFDIEIKVMLLIRPDIIYSMPIHNLNQKIRDNSVLLQWTTRYKDYRNSKLFNIADNFLSSQQDSRYDRGVCWDYYFPYKITNNYMKIKDNAFIGFLRYSLYKPRDILTMLNELTRISSGKNFKLENFYDMGKNYSNYLKGELKDYMLIYMSNEEFTSFYSFFRFFKHSRFNYEEFKKIHALFIAEITGKKPIPSKMVTPEGTLQLLYDSNIICYHENGKKHKMFWCYKERSYANIQPEVKLNSNYSFHKAFAKAFNIV